MILRNLGGLIKKLFVEKDTKTADVGGEIDNKIIPLDVERKDDTVGRATCASWQDKETESLKRPVYDGAESLRKLLADNQEELSLELSYYANPETIKEFVGIFNSPEWEAVYKKDAVLAAINTVCGLRGIVKRANGTAANAIVEAIIKYKHGALGVVSVLEQQDLDDIDITEIADNLGIEELIELVCNCYGSQDIQDISNGHDLVYFALTKNKNVIKDFVRSIKALYIRDKVTGRLVTKNAERIYQLFGEKYGGILSYLERRRDRESLLKLEKICDKEGVAREISKIRMGEFGNKQAERLVNLAYYLDIAYKLGLQPEITENLQASYEEVESKSRKYILEKLGIQDLDKAIKFIPWLKTGDTTALKVLRGENVEKFGIARSYELGNDVEVPYEDIKNDLWTYAQTIGLDIKIEDINDLNYLKSVAEKIMSEVGRKKDIKPEVLGEIKPNLSRILNLTYKAGRTYRIDINPSDLESQMEVLQNVTSCLSPGGGNFLYAQEYLKNPYTFWAVIKNEKNIVGRATVFIGEKEEEEISRRVQESREGDSGTGNEKNKDYAIARASKVYSTAPVSEEVVDGALQQYAKESGYTFLHEGIFTVPGLTKVYDDFVHAGEKPGVVVIKK